MLNYLMTYSNSYYDFGDTSLSDTAAGAGIFAGVFGTLLLISTLPLILLVVAQWKIFKKCGEEGWKAIIPIYNMITLFKIVKIKPIWILLILIPGLGSIAVGLLNIFATIRLCKGFSKSDGFIVGSILLSFIFMLILAFDNSTWDASKIDLTTLSFLNDDAIATPAGAKSESKPEEK